MTLVGLFETLGAGWVYGIDVQIANVGYQAGTKTHTDSPFTLYAIVVVFLLTRLPFSFLLLLQSTRGLFLPTFCPSFSPVHSGTVSKETGPPWLDSLS